MFHQIEGLVVGEGITLGDLKGTIEAFLHALFGPRYPVRFRPSFFPYTEPSVEVDLGCVVCGGQGLPGVQEHGLARDPRLGHGAPGGVRGREQAPRARRLRPRDGHGLRLRHGHRAHGAWSATAIDDIRLFYDGDLRFLEQFGAL